MLPTDIIGREYPGLEGMVYADVCQMGLPPKRTLEAARGFWQGYDAALRSGGPTGFRETQELARARLAQLVGGRTGEIALTKNTTEGVSILADGYPLGPGDNVVTCDLENPSNLYPWFNAAQRHGFEVRVAQTQQGRVTVDDLVSLMDSRTRILSLSAVQAGTGYRADLAALAEACRARSAILAVDAIQALGRLTLDAPALGVDYLSCGGYKGLLAGFGVGFLWCRSGLIERIHPPAAGPQSAQDFVMPPQVIPGPQAFALRTDAGRFEAGTHNAPGVAALSASLSLILELGPEAIEAHVLALEAELRQALPKGALTVLTPENPRRQSGMVVAYYPPQHEPQVSAVLERHQIRLTHRPGYLRLAIGLHNTSQDMDKLSRALRLE